MRTAFRWSLRLALVLTLLVALFIAHSIWFKPLHIRIFFDRVFAEYLFKNPEMMSGMRILPSWMNWYNDDLADASLAFEDQMREKLKNDYATLKKWLGVFISRFFANQYKRSAVPNGPKIVSGGALSPRGDWRMPSDASAAVWLAELDANTPAKLD